MKKLRILVLASMLVLGVGGMMCAQAEDLFSFYQAIPTNGYGRGIMFQTIVFLVF